MIRWLLRLLGMGNRQQNGGFMVDDGRLNANPPEYNAGPSGDNQGGNRVAKPGTLAAIIGFAAAAIALTIVPKDESGRTVDVSIADDGTATVRHVRGPQYLQAYLDVAGIATACDGIIRINGRPVRIGDVFSAEQCDAELEKALVAHAEGMMRCTPAFRNYPDKEAIGKTLAAATSFTYNVGVGGYCGSTAARRFNAGDWRGGCQAMMAWNKATFPKPQPGVKCTQRPNGLWLCEVRGLTLRRERERALCLKGLR